MQNHGPWGILSSREVYRDPWLDVRVDNVLRPDGLPVPIPRFGSSRHLRDRSGDHGELYLTREFHYAVGRETIEGVSGGIEVDETPLQSAERELREEIGIVAKIGSNWDGSTHSPRPSLHRPDFSLHPS